MPIFKVKLITTLKLLEKVYACEEGMDTLMNSLKKTEIDTKPINLLHILESNGLNHFFWAWRATTKKEKQVKRMILHDIVKEVQPIFEKRTNNLKLFPQVLKALSTGRGLVAAKNAAYAATTAAADDAAYAAAAYAADDAAYAAATAAAYAAYAATTAAADDAAYAAAAAAYAAAGYAAAYAAKAKQTQIKIIKKYLK